MTLELVCEFLDLETLENKLTQRSLQLGAFRAGKYDRAKIIKTYEQNVTTLRDGLHAVEAAGFHAFRISSSLFPLFDVAGVDPLSCPRVLDSLAEIGRHASQTGMRLTTHPGQFVVLSSLDEAVVARSLAELEMHGRIFDAIGLPRTQWASINVHGGKRGRGDALAKAIDRLSDGVRTRLTLENDEFSFTALDVAHVSLSTGVPLCLDSHHHSLNDGGIDLCDAHDLAIATWPDEVRPLQHLSNSEPSCGESITARRKHSWMVHNVPQVQLDAHERGVIDISMEFKGKNIAILAAVKSFGLTLAT